MAEKVFVYDTTLRDGAQQEGMNLSVADKVALLPIIEAMGADYIEGGWPGAIPRDTAFFEQLKEKNPLSQARLVAFGATCKVGLTPQEDPQIAALVDSQAPILCLVAKSDIRHVDQALRTTGEENLRMISDSVRYLRQMNREVMIDLEHFFDGFSFDPQYATLAAATAFAAGASWVILCDTNGGTLPSSISATIYDLRLRLLEHGMQAPQLGIHAHDDGGCAVANTITAVDAGCRQIQGTINGYGERTGNANLITCVADLQIKTPYELVTEHQLSNLSKVAYAVSEITNISPARRQPYIGVCAFAHKAGLHASAIRVNPDLYQHIDPMIVGNDMRMLVSDMAGRASVELKAREFGIDLSQNKNALAQITDRVKTAEAQGYTYDAADASFELLIREIVFGERPRYFEIESWSTHVATQAHNVSQTYSEANVKIHAGGRRIMRIGEGVGPVDALDSALRTALKNVYPLLSTFELIDFKVRILDSARGTGAITRVLITLKDNAGHWTTVGVGVDVIEASWEALIDGYVCGLMRNGIAPDC
ncbi:2-isopropylmalate synthase [Arcanobacterium pluranimalium]|uniref:citramalate synthase n=1 Tax=Arcanobacterium pluranimalium TaxID=108028 RepID=UPI00195DE546|nr:citramalate synthase [Arcanobacterium pluranimalium]MBM7825736.1 2-isopropylmalate synthase [Arcanobacterium pluranimalium]